MSDISTEMLQLAQQKFQDEDYLSNPFNKAQIRSTPFSPKDSTFDLEQEISQYMSQPTKDKLVLGGWANNEALPFQDNSFDCYLSCLSPMLVSNHTKMLKEATRVT